jgi:hypothetical protein
VPYKRHGCVPTACVRTRLIIHPHPGLTLDLSPLTVLRKLVVVFSHHGHGFGDEQLTLPLMSALETVTSPSLERAMLMLSDPAPQRLREVDWITLRAVCDVVRVRSPRLRVVFGLSRLASMAVVMDCERIIREGIVAHEMDELVSVTVLTAIEGVV